MQIIPRDLRVAVWNESDTHRITRFPFSFLPFYFYCVYSGTENESARKRERERETKAFELFLVVFYFLRCFGESIGKCIFRSLCVNGFESRCGERFSEFYYSVHLTETTPTVRLTQIEQFP